MKTIFVVITFLLCCFQIAFGQENRKPVEKKILICSDCFPLTGKPIFLPKPKYPNAARLVHASGEVSVQVLIDENGNVIEAKAVSGHPLLRAESVKVALASKWKPIILSGKPIKVTGNIVYNYVPDQITPPTQNDEKTGLIQNTKAKTITDSAGGTTTGEALNLPKPAFPANCRCQFSKNYKTTVQFIVNESGDVESAKAIYGHPILRGGSEAAIRNSKFSVSSVDNRPVKAYGLIIYDYRISKKVFKPYIVKYELKLNKNDLYK